MDGQPGQMSALRSDLTARWMAVLGLLFGSLRVLLDSIFNPALLRDGQYAFVPFIDAIFGLAIGFAVGNAAQLRHQNRRRAARRTICWIALFVSGMTILPVLLLLFSGSGWKEVSEFLCYYGSLPRAGSLALLLWGFIVVPTTRQCET